jgi:soluble lytic murein transglycosylase
VKKRISFLFLLAVVGIMIYWWHNNWLERSQDKAISLASHRYHVPFSLIKAVVWKESHFHPRITGRAGERGLMQIMPRTASEWAQAGKVNNFQGDFLFDSQTNLYAGTWYLQKLLQRYTRTDNPAAYALADYNAGRSNVLKWNKGAAATNSQVFIEQIGFPGTRRYVTSILDRVPRYSEPPEASN